MDVKQTLISTLKPYPNNPRKGNIKVIAESLKAYGQYKPVTVNQRTGEILAGNHTVEAARSLGWEKVAVAFVDVDDAVAAKIVAIDNRSSDLGRYDNDALLDLLNSLPTLDGSGYDASDLDDLKALMEESTVPTVGLYGNVGVGETGQNSVATTPSLDEYRDRYAEKATRMLIADYPNDTYVWLMDKLGAYRKENDLTSNADAIIHILEGHFGEQAPE